jgi:hypothetical protein
LIFFMTAALYISCFVVSVILIRCIGHRLRHPRLILGVGLVAMVPMVLTATESLALQMTSAHYQQRTHIPAVITITASFGIVLMLWLAVDSWHRRTVRST